MIVIHCTGKYSELLLTANGYPHVEHLSACFYMLVLPLQLNQKRSCLQCRPGFDPWVGKIPWRRKWQMTPVSLPGKFHGQRSLVGCSPWDHKESCMTEQLTHLTPNRDEGIDCQLFIFFCDLGSHLNITWLKNIFRSISLFSYLYRSVQLIMQNLK